MKINLKLFVSLAEYLPPGARDNIVTLDVDADETPMALLQRLNVPLDKAHLWLLNGVYLEPEERATKAMREGDTLAVDRKSTRLNSSHRQQSRMPSSA